MLPLFLPKTIGKFTIASLNPSGYWRADTGVRSDGAARFTSPNSEWLSKTSVALGGAGTAFSISLWIHPDTLASDRTIFSFGGDIAGGFILQREGIGNKLRLAWGGSDSFDGPTFTTTAAWSHIVVTATGTTVEFWVNGSKTVGSRNAGVASFSYTDSKTVAFGRKEDTTNQYFDGRMQHPIIGSRIWTDSEIADLYNSSAGIPLETVQVHSTLSDVVYGWAFNELSGQRTSRMGSANLVDNNTVTEAAGKIEGKAVEDNSVISKVLDQGKNGYNLIQTTVGKKPVLKTNILNGKPIIRFDGTNDIMSVNMTTKAKTVMVAFRAGVAGGVKVIFSHNFETNYNNGLWATTTNGCTYFLARSTSASGINLAANWANNNIWRVATFDYDNTHASMNIRINGVGQSSTTCAANNNNVVATDITGNFFIGGRGDGSLFFDRDIAEMVVFDPKQTASNIVKSENNINSRWSIY